MPVRIYHKNPNDPPVKYNCNFDFSTLDKYPDGTAFCHDLDKDWEDQPMAYKIFRMSKGGWLRFGNQPAKRYRCGHFRIGNVCYGSNDSLGQHAADLPFQAADITRIGLEKPVGETVIFGGEYIVDVEPKDLNNDGLALDNNVRDENIAAGAVSTEGEVPNTNANSTVEVYQIEPVDADSSPGAMSISSSDDSEILSIAATMASSARSSVKTTFSVQTFPGAKKSDKLLSWSWPTFGSDFKTTPLTDEKFSSVLSLLNISGRSVRYRAVLNRDAEAFKDFKSIGRSTKKNYHDLTPDQVRKQADRRLKRQIKRTFTGYVPGRVLK